MPQSLFRMFVHRLRSQGLASSIRSAVSYLLRYGPRSMPELTSLVVEVTTFCNLECPGCWRSIRRRGGKWRNRHMSTERFRYLIQQVPTAWYLTTQGTGEPTLHPELPQLIRIAHESGKFRVIRMSSNGLARDVPYYEDLFRAGLTNVRISVDALDQTVADKVRTGTSVQVLERRLRELGRRFPGKISIGIVVRAENVEHIADLLSRLNQMGTFSVELQAFCDFGYPPGILSPQARQAVAANLAGLVPRFENLSIPGLDIILPQRDVCRAPWNAPAVTVDGYLAPCCILMDEELIHFGNVFETSFPDLWQSEPFEDFRRIMEHKLPRECEGCGFFEMR